MDFLCEVTRKRESFAFRSLERRKWVGGEGEGNEKTRMSWSESAAWFVKEGVKLEVKLWPCTTLTSLDFILFYFFFFFYLYFRLPDLARLIILMIIIVNDNNIDNDNLVERKMEEAF